MLFKGLSIFRSGGQFVHWDRKIFSNFGRGSPKEHLREIILKLVHWSRRRCCLRVFFSIFSSGGHFVQRSGTILKIVVEDHPRNISVKLFLNREKMSFKGFSISSSGGHFVQRSRTSLAILVDGLVYQSIGLGGDVI